MKSLAPRLIPVAIASILCGVAVAGGGKDHHMSMMDQDGDGKVTAAEHAKGAKAMFSKLDKDSDGNITAQEMNAVETMREEKEHATVMKEGTAVQERQAYDKAYDSSGTGKSMPAGKSSAQKMAAMDANNDGKVTEAEFLAKHNKSFSKMDSDGNGTLTAQEWSDGQRKEKEMTAGDME